MNLRRKVRPEVKQWAKEMRHALTRHEEILWHHLRCRRLGGLRFHRQSVIRGYIADFYCPEMKLIVEVDGPTHKTANDNRRDRNIFNATGIRTIRFTNSQVLNNTKGVVDRISKACGFNDTRDANRVKRDYFSTFKQGQEQSQESLNPKSQKPPCCDEPCGNGGKVGKRQPCTRQVYATKEVAEDTLRALRNVQILGNIITCDVCGRIHIEERKA